MSHCLGGVYQVFNSEPLRQIPQMRWSLEALKLRDGHTPSLKELNYGYCTAWVFYHHIRLCNALWSFPKISTFWRNIQQLISEINGFSSIKQSLPSILPISCKYHLPEATFQLGWPFQSVCWWLCCFGAWSVPPRPLLCADIIVYKLFSFIFSHPLFPF